MRYKVLLLILSIMATSSTGLIQTTQDNGPGQKHQVKTNTTHSSANSTVIQKSTHNTDENSCTADTDCPPWASCNVSKCVCSEDLQNNKAIKCDKATLQLSILACHCVTYDNETNHTTEGKCLQNCVFPSRDVNKRLRSRLPQDVSSLNKFMCEDRWNRTGRLCGQCLPGHSPLVYSYDFRCVKCPEGNKNVWKYILAAYAPLTLFYFFVLFFKINATSSHLHGFLIFSQIISTPASARYFVLYEPYLQNLRIPTKFVRVLYMVWNLDFFRGFYPDICLDVSPLTALALDYTVAIYPLLLTVVSYFLIELHDRNFRIVVLLWKPFRCVFTLFRRNWNSRTSVIDAYATFFLLSFIKILWVSSDLLIPVRAHDLNSDNYTWVLHYDATVDFFGTEHLPYAILALVLSTVLTIIPTLLLLLYPFKWFQRIMNYLKLHCQILQVVMESFNGCYKNGTESGTRDCRWFVSVPLIGRFILLLTYALTLDGSVFPLAVALIMCIVIATVTIQPYKRQFTHYTAIDVTFWGFLAILYCVQVSVVYSFSKSAAFSEAMKIFRAIIGIVPLVYMICITGYWMLSRMRKVKIVIDRVKVWKRGYIEDDFELSLPDRLVNPEEYQRDSITHELEETSSNDSATTTTSIDIESY